MKIFTDRIRSFHGKIVYEILGKTKESKHKFFPVYREYLDGQKRATDNLLYYPIAGYQAKGIPERRMYNCNHWKTPGMILTDATEDSLEAIFKVIPDFRYVVRKMHHMFTVDVLKCLRTFLQHPEMEIMLNYHLDRIATNITFLKMKKERQKSIVRYIIDNIEECTPYSICLADVLHAMKFKTSLPKYYFYINNRLDRDIDYNTFLKLFPKGISQYDYKILMRNLKEYFPERLNEDYWTSFKDKIDFLQKERKVNEEIKAIKILEDLKKKKAMQKNYTKAISKIKKWNGTFNGIQVYIPTDISDIEKQAKALSQCLITNDYIQRVIEKKCFLVFLKSKDNPLATAEFSMSKKLIQFYGDEMDPDNCLPSKDAKIALKKYTSKFLISA